ncbi:hypothetical protein TSST111916_17790 [Tsukamurella strandjordii]|uniref:hypothetical protein n=1 Tax=Tsukamurella TaxID=2060 RepID=UPI001C7DC787|nr:hypothetical protein [Tsukamurella sp. TY48]GIZ97168.1 hypothetical protein TTY48_17800 [Tsukamurella sp. TY48]
MTQQVSDTTAPPVGGDPAAEAADAQRAMAMKLIGLLFGAALLIGCSFAVSHLNAWGAKIGMPWVFLAFVLAMMIASHFTVAGATALWQALRRPPSAAK